MKKLMILSFVFCLQIQLFGQEKLNIEFKEIIQINKEKVLEIANGDRLTANSLEDKMAETKNFLLEIDGVRSNYTELDKVKNDLPNEGGLEIVILNESKKMVHKNLEEQLYYQKEFIGREIMVFDSLVIYDWMLTKEHKFIEDFKVNKATSIMDERGLMITA